jgi:hypothetical protein
MALSSPGVEVKVIDESFYTPAAPGTVPLVIVATAENKQNGGGTGIAPGTLKANAGQVYLITSQKDLVDTFGDPAFKTDSNNNPIHAGEQNEYGLQAAYSLLGVSNRAFIVRADLDLDQLNASNTAPAANASNGTHWLDTQNTAWGIFEWDGAAASAGGQKFVNKTPIVITDPTQLSGAGAPVGSLGKNGSYAVVVTDTDVDTPALTTSHPLTFWYRNENGGWVQIGSDDWNDSFNDPPSLAIQPHTDVPQWKAGGATPAITGSVWIKTTEPNLGSRWRVKRYNSGTEAWEALDAPLYSGHEEALYKMDKSGGGANLALGTVYIHYNTAISENQIFRRGATGKTTIKTSKITASSFTAGMQGFLMAESLKAQLLIDGDKVVEFEATESVEDAIAFANAINSAGFVNVEAAVDSQNRVVITHDLGGNMHFTENDTDNNPLASAGFTDYIYEPSSANYGTGVRFLQVDYDGDHDFVASNWEPLVYVASNDAPTSLTTDGALWYSSVIDEIDIMVHDGSKWVGYLNEDSPFYNADPEEQTDPMGPIVSATAPETQSDGTALKAGDLWVSTADMENFPTIYKYNSDLMKWVLVDTSDQSTEDGALFSDARYNTSGTNSYEAGAIEDLLASNFVDTDAPDPALYPKGMLLWNLRRSGFNVKQFKQNYVDTAADNARFNGESMESYYPHRWVTISGNQDNGSGTFGRKAQRKVIVQALQATTNSNQAIRDEESRIFNLIACPGYPELIGEMITLNYDRGLTAFVVGDTPARLTPDATSLLAWGLNQNLALEDNDKGGVSYDEYMGMYYPWGFTSDNFGNNVAVPPSHMVLRTIALNDQVAYPWFAPAGVRRGGVTNATAVGYVDSEGEFNSVALNNGQRDTLYEVKINPIAFLTGTGLVVYGQKTRAKAASSLDRVNVARLVCYLRRQLSVLAKPYIFEPNDKITRDQIKSAAESIMLELVGQRALYDYIVVCDESNNTPARIDRNELYLDIAIEPVKAVEFIYIPLRLKNTGEIKALG